MVSEFNNSEICLEAIEGFSFRIFTNSALFSVATLVKLSTVIWLLSVKMIPNLFNSWANFFSLSFLLIIPCRSKVSWPWPALSILAPASLTILALIEAICFSFSSEVAFCISILLSVWTCFIISSNSS